MSAINVNNRLGVRFAVAGNWVFDGEQTPRTVGGNFRVTVLANSAEDATKEAASGDIYDSTSPRPTPERAVESAEQHGLLESNDDLPQLVIGIQRRRKAGPWEPCRKDNGDDH